MKTVLQAVHGDSHDTIFKRLMASRHVNDLRTIENDNHMRYEFKILHASSLRWRNLLSCFRESGIITAHFINNNAVITTAL